MNSPPKFTARNFILIICGLGLTGFIVLLLCAMIGPTSIALWQMDLSAGLRQLFADEPMDPAATILFRVRLPRLLLAGIVGAALGAAGTGFQALLRNPLAEPYILGVSGGGALGAIAAMMLGLKGGIWGMSAVPLFAFVGSFSTMLLVFSIARTGGRVPTHTLLLTGVIMNAFLSAVIMFLVSLMSSEKVHTIVFWMMGNLDTRPYPVVLAIGLYVIIGLVVLLSMARSFNLLSLGEESALHLGLNVERNKLVVFVAASLITGAVVSVSGLIGFVGLIVPHIGRLILGSDHRLLLPASVFIGAMFLMICDTIARTIFAPSEIPVGVVTAICGGPFFIYLLRTRQSKAFVED